MRTGFLEENPGEKSWVRLQSLWFTTLASYLIMVSPFRAISLEIFIITVAAAVAPKVVQKFAENKTFNKAS